MQLSFAFWFAISMTLAQVFISAAQAPSTYPGSGTDEGGYSGTPRDSSFDASGYAPEESESRTLTDY